MAGEQRGRFVRYRLDDPRLDQLLALADALLAGAAEGVGAYENYGGPASRA